LEAVEELPDGTVTASGLSHRAVWFSAGGFGWGAPVHGLLVITADQSSRHDPFLPLRAWLTQTARACRQGAWPATHRSIGW